MNRQPQRKLVAIVGGSGSGKTWLAGCLNRELSRPAARVSLDNFYLERPDLPPAVRSGGNFDHPRAVDWDLALRALRNCRDGQPVEVPGYDFATHTRQPGGLLQGLSSVVLVEGLWLLWLPRVRELFDLKIFLECPLPLRFERRLARDVGERGRTAESVRAQFWETVTPMHERFVAPQRRWADLVLSQPPRDLELRRLLARLESLASGAVATAAAPRADLTEIPPAVALRGN